MPSGSSAPPVVIDGLSGEGTDLGRLTALSDGIFGFSMTLLVVILVLPTVGAAGGPTDLLEYLRKILPALGGYAISFFVVATWWSAHHRVFAALRRYDEHLMRLNNVFLLLISITPFLLALVFEFGPQSLFSEGFSAKLSVGLYSGAQVGTGLVFLAMWRHATTDRRLVDPQLPREWVDYVDQQGRGRVVVMAIAVVGAAILPVLGELLWIGVLLARRHIVAPARTPPG
ncbi:MAG: DUF1211 domain-containing protein [Thermoplasmata archaeon]|nr:DUF1211 domain-containing protein [Thermoplasmata archaeon]